MGPNSGRACPGAELCAAGTCACPTGWVRCKGACINPQDNEAFCGAKLDCVGANAGTVCGANMVCEAGACKSGCKAGEVLCDGSCIKPKTDFNYCGAKLDCAGTNAGKTCALGEVCSDGTCKKQCKTGEILCGKRCVNPLVDNAFCGASGNCVDSNAGTQCEPPNSCVDGTCKLYCNPWQTKCGNACINGQSDPQHCGAVAGSDCEGANKGVVCGAEKTCSQGRCVPAGCKVEEFSVKLPKSDVVLLLDKSGSMNTKDINVGGTSTARWAVLHDVVTQLIADYKSKVRFGLSLYPKVNPSDTLRCEVLNQNVEVPVSESSNDNIISNMPGRTATVQGRTPLASGLNNAVTHAKSIAPRNNGNPTAVMVIADGGMSYDNNADPANRCPNQTDTELNRVIAQAAMDPHKIPIYSVGLLLDANARQLLERVAGGSANYIQASNKTELANAMGKILSEIPSCKIPLRIAPQFHEMMKVKTSDGTSSFDAPWQYKYADCAAVEAANQDRGFVYVKRSGPYDEIELCDKSCKDYKNTAQVEIIQNCPPPP